MSRRRLALVFLAVMLSLAAAIVVLSRVGYAQQDRDVLLSTSSAKHLAGTDALGRDRMVRVAFALLLSFAGSVGAAVLTTAAAAAIGVLAALGPGRLGRGAMLVCDVFLALPWLFLLMMVRAALPLTTTPGRSAATTFLVLAALGWPACARAVYRGTVDLRKSDWMLQARASGLQSVQLLRHLIPNLRALLIPQFLISVPAFVMAEANLGALGLGVGEPLPSWGGMLLELDNSSLLLRTNWVYLPIALLVLLLLLLEAISVEA